MLILDSNLSSRLSPEDSSGTTSSTSSSGDSVRARSPTERNPVERSQSQRSQIQRSPLQRVSISRPEAMNTLTRPHQQPYMHHQQQQLQSQPIVRTPSRSQQVLCDTLVTFFHWNP